MAGLASVSGLARNRRLKQAVYQHRALSRDGLSERLFALLFSGLVYPQIWEDPEVDMAAMELGQGHRVVTIASGGCNVLSYLTRAPDAIDVVDLNPAHIALNNLKLAATRHLPGQTEFFRFFGAHDTTGNDALYDRYLAPHLDRPTRQYWESRDWRGRRRITAFNRNFYKSGLLGWCIATGHAAAKMHGVDPGEIMTSRCLRDQRRFFEQEIAPLFDRPLIRFATRRKASLFGLGIPPAQYDELAAAHEGGTIADVLRGRLEKLACHFSLRDNYFAWQAFARRYPEPGEAKLPPYLEAVNFDALRDNSGRVRVHHANFAELLAAKPAASVDRYILLDAQDWMTDRQLNDLWSEITRTAAAGARVIFRTAGVESILEGRVSEAVLDQWDYRDAESLDHTRRDRSAIYGGFHLYVKAG